MKKKLCKLFASLLAVITLAVSTTVYAKDVGDFSDVSAGSWFYDYVADVTAKELMTGLNDTTFGPAEELSRGQFATVLYRMDGSPAITFDNRFPDIEDGSFYSLPVIWASTVSVITGYDDGYFGPGDNLTREQMVTMLYRYAYAKGDDVSNKIDYDNYPDAVNVSPFASEAMHWAIGNGIITGDNGRLNPQGNVSRAVCATMISRFTGGSSITPPVIPDIPETGSTYVLNTSTHRFHYPSCRDVNKIAQENYASSDRSRDELIADGYSSCGHCNP